MEFQEQKRTFMRSLVQTVVSVPGEVTADKKLGVPDRLIEKWCRQFKTIPPLNALPLNPRLVNGFTLGADPEMTIGELNPLYPAAVKQQYAQKIGLHTGLAFGMDMNGRLVEFRPYPSCFALDIVASLLAELRWLAMFHPATLKYSWVSMPFDGQDGVGGHVHLARKRNNEQHNVDIILLDRVYTALIRTGVFNKPFNDSRVANTKYGHSGDYRLQRHGYEYRSFPTWLDDPWLAYFVLVVCKLVFADPVMASDGLYHARGEKLQLERFFQNLFAYFKNKDDDAWIAAQAQAKWGLPKQKCVDIKANWGILYPAAIVKCEQMIIPEYIISSAAEKQDIFKYLVEKAAIPPRIPICNWQPEKLLEGYEWMMNYTETYHKIGIGEIVAGLATHNKARVCILASDDRQRIQFVSNDSSKPREGLDKLKALGKFVIHFIEDKSQPTKYNLYLPQDLRSNENIPLVKEILTTTDFPVWKVGEVKPGLFELWKERSLAAPQNNRKFLGKELTL